MNEWVPTWSHNTMNQSHTGCATKSSFFKAGCVSWQRFPSEQRLALGEFVRQTGGHQHDPGHLGAGLGAQVPCYPIQTHTFNHLDNFTVTKIILQPEENTEKDHWQRRVGSWISMLLEVKWHSKWPNQPEVPGGSFPDRLQFFGGISKLYQMESVC